VDSKEEEYPLFKQSTIERLKIWQQVFPNSKLTIHYATKEQIEQLKSAGIRGVSRRQRK
jgi:uncharacterized protein YqkB